VELLQLLLQVSFDLLGRCTAGLFSLFLSSSPPLRSHVRTSSSVISTWHCMPKCLPSA